VLDAGTPRELVDRYGSWAKVSFSSAVATELAHALRAVSGVEDARASDHRVEVHGTRSMVAHVGAELVHRGAVPPDLRVDMPDLEDAVLALLRGEGTSPMSELEGVGGAR